MISNKRLFDNETQLTASITFRKTIKLKFNKSLVQFGEPFIHPQNKTILLGMCLRVRVQIAYSFQLNELN